MNRTKIEWCDFSWNPVVGCLHGCWFCYGRNIARRFPKKFPNGFRPTFHPERLMEPWEYKKPSKIFVCSIADLFAPWTEKEWRNAVIRSAWMCPVPHTFQFLTKDPELIPNMLYPKNFWMGATVTTENKDWINIEHIKKVQCGVKFVSFEPLLGAPPGNVKLEGLDWIIVGKLTGSRRVKLDPNWVDLILGRARYLGIPIFMKNNLKPEYPHKLFQEFPK